MSAELVGWDQGDGGEVRRFLDAQEFAGPSSKLEERANQTIEALTDELGDLTRQRDSARNWAVALEGEVSHLQHLEAVERRVKVWSTAVFLIAITVAWVLFLAYVAAHWVGPLW